MHAIQLLVIDAQNDFCDRPFGSLLPALPVPGAYQDCLRLVRLIDRLADAIDAVVVTLDLHHSIDLAHHTMWRDANGAVPPPFTQVTAADLRSGRYRTLTAQISADAERYVLQYLQNLEQQGLALTLWPPHCLVGSPGANLNAELAGALQRWETRRLKPIDVIEKGLNIWTENFSALKAVIPYPGDADTDLNRHLLDQLAGSDSVWVAGQASSHCVRQTVLDLLQYGPADVAERLTLLTDCMSPVPGCEFLAEQFFNDVRQRGVRLAASSEIGLVRP
ncbi:hypothetical protein [Methylomonas koyamae]|uniref:hypothetical protein n=1 Tax=Methylomonas koyamae TaxID=702114 RepID=UPI002873A01A|nr:hypothetical protein [Methylomonas koyamae]WNB75889.1 hypothetical protein RI210_21870 [Methylomonas koyamae]